MQPIAGHAFFHGPEAVKRYFGSLGIQYIAYTDFERALTIYNRGHWLANRSSPEAIWRFEAPYFLDLMDNLEQLASSSNRVSVFGAQRLVHLD